MHYLEFLEALHRRLQPRTYLEIGVAEGHSLSRSRCRSIGIDPGFHVTQEQAAAVSLFRCTSDEYFERLTAQGDSPFDGLPVDLAYIDGMHHFEFALRDFIAVERCSSPAGVIAFDDVLPRDVAEAARTPRPRDWTGDVFRIWPALAAYRPDLRLVCVRTAPTGTLLVAGLNPNDTRLGDQLDDIVREYVQPDPQPIPTEVLTRKGTVTAKQALALALWDKLRAQRL